MMVAGAVILVLVALAALAFFFAGRGKKGASAAFTAATETGEDDRIRENFIIGQIRRVKTAFTSASSKQAKKAAPKAAPKVIPKGPGR